MNRLVPFTGHSDVLGRRAGFLSGGEYFAPGTLQESVPIITRGLNADVFEQQFRELQTRIERGDNGADLNALMLQIAGQQRALNRAITSTTSNLPIRENLEAEAKILVPMNTPLRNRIPRRVGAGLASKWKQLTSLGGGFGASSTSTGSGNTSGQATITVASAAGFYAGDSVYIGSGGTAETKIISSINYSTNVITLTSNLANAQNSKTVVKINFQPDTVGAVRAFFSETGAPADHASTYATLTATYKLMGTYGSVTGLAMAAGANFQDQLATEKANAIRNMMLNEENALINGDSTSVYAPWGDGTTAFAFDGLLNLIATGNSTPASQIQSSVGALTTAHIDAQLGRLYNQGAEGLWILCNEQEARSLAHLAEASGSIIRVVAGTPSEIQMGKHVSGYVHPITGELIPILVDRFLSSGTMVFGCDRLPDGSPALDIEVLPQVQLPDLAPNENVQGYVAQELAPATSAPQVYPFIVTVYEVLRMKSALHFAKSTGLTAV